MTTSEAASRLLGRFEGIVGTARVLVSLPDKLAYSRDCWPEGIILVRGGRLFERSPMCVVQPGTEDETAACVRAAVEAGVPVVPFGAGSGVCGGALPEDGGVVIDLKRLRDIEWLSEEGTLARVGAGALGIVVQTEFERRGLTLGHFPSSIYCSTLGGYLAARSAGQSSSRFGKIEDMVQSLRFVDGRGALIDTAPGPLADRWGGGPDPTQLVVGSEGTLGVITSGVVRLMPAPETQIYRGFRCDSVEAGCDLARQIMHAGLRPAVLRLYDEFDTLIAGGKTSDEDESPLRMMDSLREVAVRTLPAALTGIVPEIRGRVSRAARGLLGRAIGQPLLLNQLTEAIPGGCLMVVGFEGDAFTAHAEAEAGLAILRQHAVDLGPGPGEHWLHNRYNVSYKQSAMFDAGAFVDTMEVATTWSNLSRLYHAVKRAVRGRVFIMAHFSHAYSEGASIYFTFAGFGADLDETLDVYRGVWKAAQAAVIECGATVSHHHGVGLSKAANVPTDHVGGEGLFLAAKAGFDPAGIFNPGKVWTQASLDERASVQDGLRSRRRRPQALKDVEACLADARRGEVVWPVGGGHHTRDKQGDPALPLSGLSRVLGWDSTSRTVSVEPGVTIAQLGGVLSEASGSLCTWRREHPASTIGGLLARYLPIQPALWNGSVRESCISLSALTGGGDEYRYLGAPRKAAGPDLRHFFLGAEARFGIITAATLGVGAAPEARRCVRLRCPSMAAAAAVLTSAFLRGLRCPNVILSGRRREAWVLLEGAAPTVAFMADILESCAQGEGATYEPFDPDEYYDPGSGDLRAGADPVTGKREDARGGVAIWGRPCALAQLPDALLRVGVWYDISAHQASVWLPASVKAARELPALLRDRHAVWVATPTGHAFASVEREAGAAMTAMWTSAKLALDPRGILPPLRTLEEGSP
jgi:alkyldihydroxyacetonephosphate synthase